MATPMNLLLIEDDQMIGKVVRKGFEETGHECAWEKTGASGLAAALGNQFDAIILDLMLPEKNGMEVLRELRSSGLRTPVLLLTALGTVDEKVAGLSAGADDYLVKPFAFPELVARVDAICRRALNRPAPVLRSGALVLDLTSRKVMAGDQEILLTPTEFSLLELLLRHAGQVVPRRMLCQHLWDTEWEGYTNVIEVHMNRLRNKLRKAADVPLIETVRSRGYYLPAL